jgi:hypothetical protein
VQGLAIAIKVQYPVIAELFELAAQEGIPIYEPFTGARIGPFTVLSPSKTIYQHLIPQFRKTPSPNVDLLKERRIWLGDNANLGILTKLLEKAAQKVTNWVSEKWDFELLKEGGMTAPENESCTVLFGDRPLRTMPNIREKWFSVRFSGEVPQ